MTSLNSEVIDTQYINQEEIMQLTKDVRKFSESLTQLRDIFTDEEGEHALPIFGFTVDVAVFISSWKYE